MMISQHYLFSDSEQTLLWHKDLPAPSTQQGLQTSRLQICNCTFSHITGTILNHSLLTERKMLTHTHTHTRLHAHTNAQTHTHPHTRAHLHAHTNARTCTHTHTHIFTQSKDMCICKHTHRHTHTHTHSHSPFLTLIQILWS